MSTATKERPVTETTQIATRTPEVIRTPDEYRESLRRWRQQDYNMLTPFTNISGLAEQHGIIASVVQINTDKLVGEIYDGLPFLKQDEVAIAKNGLRKIAEGLGVSTRLEYVSVGTIRHYWHVKAIASYKGIDGTTVVREASQEWDLRDGSDRLKGWTANQTSEARKHGLRACETRAINAVIRECGTGIKQAYKRAELAKAFVAVRVVFLPDMTDPETRRLVTERSLAGTNALYPGGSRALPQHDYVDEEPSGAGAPEPRSVGAGSTATAASPAKAESDPPPNPNAVRIVDVKTKTGRTGNRDWMKYTIVDSNGEEHGTFDKKIGELAEKFKADRTWADIVDIPTEDGKYKNVEELSIAQPSLLPPEDKL